MARFRTLPDSDRWIEPRTLSDRTAVLVFSLFHVLPLDHEGLTVDHRGAIVKNNGTNSRDHQPIKEFRVFLRVYEGFEGWGFESIWGFLKVLEVSWKIGGFWGVLPRDFHGFKNVVTMPREFVPLFFTIALWLIKTPWKYFSPQRHPPDTIWHREETPVQKPWNWLN